MPLRTLMTTTSALGMLAAGLAVAPATAQDDAEIVDDRVIVTAQRREADLQDVPVAITAVDADTIEQRQVGDILDLQYLAPNLSLATGTGTANSARIFLRGVGEDESRGAVDPAVGIYVDGVYIGRQVGSLFDVVDLDRIEVLRGPQGTLYGRNTNGGAIKLVSVKPQGDNGGDVRVTVGNYNRLDARGTVDLAVTDTSAFRVTGIYRSRDGFHDLIPNGDFEGQGRNVGAQETTGVRAQFQTALAGDWSANFAVDYTWDNSDPVPDSVAPPFDVDNNVFTIEPLEGTICSAFTPNTFQPLGCFTGYDNSIETGGASATLTGTLGGLDVTSITAYRELKDDLASRIGFPYFQETDQDQLSQEVLVSSDYAGPFNFTAGVYYFQENVDFDSTFIFPSSLSVDTESIAVFGQGYFDVTDRLSLTGGLRFTDETRDFSGSGAAGAVTDASDFDNLSYTVIADFAVSEDVNTYASYTTSFKSAGFSPDCFSPTACFLPVDEEEVESFEVGAKIELLDRIRLNSAYFFNTYEGLQIGATVPGLGFTRFNVSETEIQGIELEAFVDVTESFELFSTIGWLDGEYTEVTPDEARALSNDGAGCTNFPDNFADLPAGEQDALFVECGLGLELKNAPTFKAQLGATQTWITYDGELQLTGDVTYEDESFSLVANSPANAVTDPGFLYNARLAYTPDSDRWTLAIFGQNLGDKEYWRAASAGSFTAYAAPPRTFGAELGVRF